MRNKIIVLGLILLLIVSFFSGCQENKVGAATFEGITLKSDIVELVNASITQNYNKFDEIWKVDVQYLFHNIAKRDINIKVTIECYDENNNLITILGPKYIKLPIDYTESKIHPNINSISYEDSNAYMIDHVTIIAIDNI